MGEFILNSPYPVLRIGKEGIVLYTNEAGKFLLEFFKIRVGERLPAGILDAVRRTSLRKKPKQIELKAGEKIYSICFTPSSADETIILSAFDITSYKQVEEELFLRDRECRLLPQIAEGALKAPDFQTMMSEILSLVAVALDSEYCKILKLLPDGNFLFEKGIGWRPEEAGKIIKKDLASMAGYTILSSRPIMVQKLHEKGSIRNLGFEGYPQIMSGISALIGSVEKPYGVLVVHSVKKEKFTKEDAYFMKSVALLISLTIERNEVEEILRTKVHFLKTLLDTVPAPVFYKDSKGIYQGCNELFAKIIVGCSKEKVTGCSIDDLSEEIPAELGEIYKGMDRQLLQKGGNQVYESKVMCSDGLRRDFLFSKATYRNLCGNIEGFVGVMLDITGRKRTEEDLQKSEERYRLIAEQTGQLIYDINLKNGSIEWAGAASELTGYSFKEIENFDFYDWLEHIHPEERRGIQQAFKRCWNTGEKFNEEFRFQRKDGTYFCVENKGVFLRDGEGCICRALGVMKDVTEIKLSSEKLRESEELYRSFLQNFKGISFKLNGDFTPLLVEGAVEEITGYTDEDFLSGRIKLYDLIIPEDRPVIDASWKKMSNSRNSILEHDYRLRQKDGNVKWVHELIHEICNNSGETVFIQGYAYDITQRKKAEEAVAKAEEIGMREIHHRIKNNLQVVSSLLNLQAEKFRDRNVIEAFRESENRVVSMSIIHEELHKSESTSSVDFAAYLKKLTAELLRSYRVRNENIQLFLDVDSMFLGIDTAIPLGIIVNELFSNSLKYAFSNGAEGRIKIILQREPEARSLEPCNAPGRREKQNDSKMYPLFTLVYSDNGGCFPENIDFKNPETLGLQLVNALVDQLDGTFELEKGEETKFTIRFNDKGF
jgi:PAS domain S-box-containing protein